MLDAPLLASLSVLALGALVAIYYRFQRQTWGTILGVSASMLGAFFTLAELAAFSGVNIILSGVIGTVAIVVFMFLTFERDPRVLLLTGIPVVILVGVYAYPLPLFLLLEYMALSIAIISAYDYSEVKVAARIRGAVGTPRTVVWVFSFIHDLVVRIFKRPSRGLVALAYLLFTSGILVVAPLLIAKVSNGTVPPEPLIIVGLVYFYLTREAIARSARSFGTS